MQKIHPYVRSHVKNVCLEDGLEVCLDQSTLHQPSLNQARHRRAASFATLLFAALVLAMCATFCFFNQAQAQTQVRVVVEGTADPLVVAAQNPVVPFAAEDIAAVMSAEQASATISDASAISPQNIRTLDNSESADEQAQYAKWYLDKDKATTAIYTISSAGEFRVFQQIVNGTYIPLGENPPIQQDGFAGKTVKLSASIMLGQGQTQQSFEPIGTPAHPFEGIFDGDGAGIYAVRGFKMELSAASNIGLFGYVAKTGGIQNLQVDNASITITVGANASGSEPEVVSNIGAIVGCNGGFLKNCHTTHTTVSVSSAQNASKNKFAIIRCVGCMAGTVEGDVENCTNGSDAETAGQDNYTRLIINATGTPWGVDQSVINSIAECIGGVVGKHGGEPLIASAGSVSDPNNTNNTAYNTSHGNISSCKNYAPINISTTGVYWNERWRQNDPAMASNVGGIVGYTIGNVSKCENFGVIGFPVGTTNYGANYGAGMFASTGFAENIGGIAGSVRSLEIANLPTDTIDYGMVKDADNLVVSDCHNRALISGHNQAGGVVGATGTRVLITRCSNSGDVTVYQWNKPAPGGIVAINYGDVSYCYNTGEVSTRAENGAGYAGGYYAAGIVSMNFVYSNPAKNLRSDTPTISCCYNAGQIRATGDYRQGAIVGSNEGLVRFCAYRQGCVPDASGRDVLTGGKDENDGDEMFSYEYAAADLMSGSVPKDKPSAIALLNSLSYDNGWTTYFVPNADSSKYPVLNGSTEVPLPEQQTNVEAATFDTSKTQNAVYSAGVAPVPTLAANLNGATLIQNVDYKVVVEPDAKTVGNTYNAQIEGIGRYSGISTASAPYSIDKANLGDKVHTCTITTKASYFNWQKQTDVSKLSVKLLDSAGNEIPSDQYVVELPDTGAQDYLHAGTYNVKVTAKDTSQNYTGTLTQKAYKILKVPLYGTIETGNSAPVVLQNVVFNGESREWIGQDESGKSTVGQLANKNFVFTGSEIKPVAGKLTYNGRDLVVGEDYLNIYGNINPDGGGTEDERADYVNVNDPSKSLTLTIYSKGGGNFTNWINVGYNIVAANISTCKIEVSDMPYTGKPMVGAVRVSINGNYLTEGVDYKVDYANNTEKGTARYTVSPLSKSQGGSGNLTGNPISGTFQITDAATSIDRIGGALRFDTAAMQAKAAYPSGAKGVVVAYGINFPDALAATSLAGALDYPILLTLTDELPEVTQNTIRELGASNAIIVGGTSVISEQVASNIGGIVGKAPTRIWGAERIATANNIYQYGLTAGEGGTNVWGDTIIVASGMQFPDALAVSPIAFKQKYPIFLVSPVGGMEGMLGRSTRDLISSAKTGEVQAQKAIIVGGDAVVNPAAQAALENVFGGSNVVRLGGATRYETSSIIASYGVNNKVLVWNGTAVASGLQFPDALAGSVLQGKSGSALLLANEGYCQAIDGLANVNNQISSIRIFGGDAAVPPSVRDKITQSLGWS